MLNKILLILVAKALYSLIMTIYPFGLRSRLFNKPYSVSMIEHDLLEGKPNLVSSKLKYFFATFIFIWLKLNWLVYIIVFLIVIFFVGPSIGLNWK